MVEIMRLGSDGTLLSIKKAPKVKMQDPTVINTMVLNPATLFFFSLSQPIIAHHKVAESILGNTAYKSSISLKYVISLAI